MSKYGKTYCFTDVCLSGRPSRCQSKGRHTLLLMSGRHSRCQSKGRHTVLLMSGRPSRCQSMGRHTVLPMSACLAQSKGRHCFTDVLPSIKMSKYGKTLFYRCLPVWPKVRVDILFF